MTQDVTARMGSLDASLATLEQNIDRFWSIHKCPHDVFLAHMVQAAKSYLKELEPAGEPNVTPEEESRQHLMLLMLWFANGREDLRENLLAPRDEESKDRELREARIQTWRQLGFPHGIRERLRKALFAANGSKKD